MSEKNQINIYRKLFIVQQGLKAPKAQRNSFGKYNYRKAEDILEATKPLCKEVEAIIMLSDEIIVLEDRFYIKATATFIDIEDGQEIKSISLAREEDSKKGMDASQVTGASSSYARKYALNGLLSIDNTDDADSMDNSDDTKKPSETDAIKEMKLSKSLKEVSVVWAKYKQFQQKGSAFYKAAGLRQKQLQEFAKTN